MRDVSRILELATHGRLTVAKGDVLELGPPLAPSAEFGVPSDALLAARSVGLPVTAPGAARP